MSYNETSDQKTQAVEQLNKCYLALTHAKICMLKCSPIASSSVEVKEVEKLEKKLLLVMQKVNGWQV